MSKKRRAMGATATAPKPVSSLPARSSGGSASGSESRAVLKAVTIGADVRKAEGDAWQIGRSRQKHISWRGVPGKSDLVEPPVDQEDLADLMLESTDFYVVVAQIARDVVGRAYHFEETREGRSSLKSQLNRDRDSAERFFEEAPGGPEGDETLQSILTPMSMDWDSTGDGYLEVSRNDEGKPDGIYHLQATRTKVRQDKMGVAQLSRSGRDVVWFRAFGSPDTLGLGPMPDDTWTGIRPQDEPDPLNEVFHFRHYHPASFWYGVAPIVPAISAVRGNTFAADRNIKFFYNKALPEIAMMVSGNTESIAQEDMQAFLNALRDHFITQLQGEHFKPLLLQLPMGIDIKIEKMSEAFKDADHINYTRNNRDEILRAYAMMPNRVGIIESGNLGGGTGESQIEIYKNSVVKPRQEIIEKRLTRLMREGLGINTLAFKFDELDTTDELAQAQILVTLASAGWILINEGRKASAPLVKRMGLELPEIPEDWADLPFPVLAPQLALLSLGIDGVDPATDDEESPHADATVAGGQNGNTRQRAAEDIYRRMFGRMGRQPGGPVARRAGGKGRKAT